jgi:predicted TIM-barrel fold metal-dependent hydrolase
MGGEFVFDCHHHYGTLLFAAGARAREIEATQHDTAEYETRLGRMRRAGIDAAVIMPVNRYMRPHGVSDTRSVNDAVAAYRDRDQSNFPVAVGITEPLHGDDGLEEIVRIDEELGMVGVSYHARWQGVTADDPLVIEGLKLLQQRRLLAFVHAHADSTLEAPFMVRHLAELFPDLPIIVTDALSGPTQAAQFLSDARTLANVYFETSCAWSLRAIAASVDALGPERILFGSDTYSAYMVTMNTPDLIRSLGLGKDATRLILSGNLLRLLDWTHRHPNLTQFSATGSAQPIGGFQ